MKNVIKKIRGSLITLIVCVFLLLLIPKVDNGKFVVYLLRYGLDPARLRFTLHTKPGVFVLSVIFLLLLAAAVWSLIRLLLLLPRLKGSRTAESQTDEQALSCDHKTGRDRYLEQLENYLESGLIDREEYNSMRQRYLGQNIPDDYHG